MRRSLVALLTVALLPLAAAVAAAQSPPGSYQRVVDITFPVAGDVRYIDSYHASRGGGTRVHQATDIMGVKLQTLHAAVGGSICFITGIGEPMPSWGYSVTLCGDDGLSYRYIHINNDNPGTDDGQGGPEWAYAPGIRRGVRVQRGQWLAYLGDSGNAEGTAPHLHFEMVDDGMVDPELQRDLYKQGRLNPFPSLEDARRRGDLPGAPDRGAGVRRVAGADRIETAMALSRERDSARTVIVAPAGSPAEALVSAPLAGLLTAPVLLSGPDGLDDRVAAEVTRLGARNAYVVGRLDQLSAQVETDLHEAGVEAHARLAAADPMALSGVVAREMTSYPALADGVERVFLALGESSEPSRSWPDALSAGALAARLHAPILLIRTDEIPESVISALADLDPGVITVLGGPVAISEAAAARAGASVPDAQLNRLAGENRYGTSVQIAAEARRIGMDGRIAWLATGQAFPDALAAGPAAALADAPLVLIDGLAPGGSPFTDAWLAEVASSLDGAIVVGGTAAITDPVREEVARIIGR